MCFRPKFVSSLIFKHEIASIEHVSFKDDQLFHIDANCMLSMLHLKHASNWRHTVRSKLSKARCSFESGSGSRLGWAHHARGLATQPKPHINSSSKSLYDGRQRLSSFWAPTGGIEATADAKGQTIGVISSLGS